MILLNGAETTFEYDTRGNLANDGIYDYEWDGRGLLSAVELPSRGLRIEYRYDFRESLIAKTVLTQGAGSGWTPQRSVFYGNSEGLAVLELHFDASGGAVAHRNTWGLDLSGSIGGAGGIGGLLAVTTATVGTPGEFKRYLAYDGLGNVTQVVDGSGVIKAHFEYTSFGNRVVATGPEAASFEWGFSTKRRDVETGLIHFGRRHYHPGMGRWLSRDPIDEGDGFNLYAYVDNHPLNRVDPFGETGTGNGGGIINRIAGSILAPLLGSDERDSMNCPVPDNEQCQNYCGTGESQCEEDFGESIPEEPGLWDKIMEGIGGLLGAAEAMASGLGNLLDQANDWVTSALGTAAEAFSNFVDTSTNWVQNAINSATGYLQSGYSALPQGLRNTLSNAVSATTNAVNRAVTSTRNWWNGLSPNTQTVLRTTAGVVVSGAVAVAGLVTAAAVGIPVGLTAAVFVAAGAMTYGGYKAYQSSSLGGAIRASAKEGAMALVGAGAFGLLGKVGRFALATPTGRTVSNAIASSLGKVFSKLGGTNLLKTASTAMRGFLGKAMKGIASSPVGRYFAPRTLTYNQFRTINAGRFSRSDLSAAWNQYKAGQPGNYLTRQPTSFERFFLDNRNFDAVRAWRGGAQGQTFEHLFIM